MEIYRAFYLGIWRVGMLRAIAMVRLLRCVSCVQRKDVEVQTSSSVRLRLAVLRLISVSVPAGRGECRVSTDWPVEGGGVMLVLGELAWSGVLVIVKFENFKSKRGKEGVFVAFFFPSFF